MPTAFKLPGEDFHPLRVLLWGADGTGKTPTALYLSQKYGPAAAFDCDGGLEVYSAAEYNYRLISTTDPVFIRDQLERLLHDPSVPGEDTEFRLMVLDPITTVYQKILSMVEKKERERQRDDPGEFVSSLNVGSWRPIKRIYHDITSIIPRLGMPSIVTAREGNLWKDNRIISLKPDCDKDLPHEFDVVIHMTKATLQGPRIATVSRDRFCKMEPRYEAPLDDVHWVARALEKAFPKAFGVKPVAVENATKEQIQDIRNLVTETRLPWKSVIAALREYGVDSLEELTPVTAGQMKERLELFKAQKLKQATGQEQISSATVEG